MFSSIFYCFIFSFSYTKENLIKTKYALLKKHMIHECKRGLLELADVLTNFSFSKIETEWDY